MKQFDISEELWSRFLEGRTNEEETEQVTRLVADNDDLLAEFLSVQEATRRIGMVPCEKPDLDLAQKQISQVLQTKSSGTENTVSMPRRSNVRRYWAVAAAVALLLGVALFFFLRPDNYSNNPIAHQPVEQTDSLTHKPNDEKMLARTESGAGKQNNHPDADKTDAPEAENEHTSQVMERQYANAGQTNQLTVTKPGKDNYRVLCKNLEKAFNFEWTATNVQSLHFSVTNAQGKTVTETSFISDNHYPLKYSDIYPEKKLLWNLVVVFNDGSREKRSGQIQIDYDL